MIPTPGPEERRQQERWIRAHENLMRQSLKTVAPGIERIRAERKMRQAALYVVRDVIDVSSPEPAATEALMDAEADDTNTLDVDFISDPFRWKRIIREVCKKYGVRPNEVMGQRRFKTFVLARHEAFYRLVHETTMSLPNIGRIMGGFDHTTVLHGYRVHMKRNGIEP